MASFVILDPIEPSQPQPDYCTHGRVTCVSCLDWCWLGSNTYTAVVAGGVHPLCHPCAARLVPADAPRVGRIEDHRRAAGPH